MPLQVWAEFLPYEEASAPTTVALLRRFDVMLCLSVQPEHIGPPLAHLLRVYEAAGLEVALWLLLPKEQGYWPSERNAHHYAAHLEHLFSWARREGVRIPWIAVDLELPLPQALRYKETRGLRQILAMGRIALTNLNARQFAEGVAHYRAIHDQIHAHGAKTLCAALDFILEDLLLGEPIIQDFLETPVLDVPWDLVSIMLYNTMVAGLLHVTVRDARWLEHVQLGALKRALGDRAAVSLGLTGVGVLGDEPHYHRPEELAPDIAVAKAAGIDQIAIFNLEGILHSPDPAAWFQVAVDTAPAVPDETPWAEREKAKRRRLARAVGWIRHLPGRG